MSPASFVKDITPVEESYDMSPDALSFPLITESAIPNVPELAVKFVPRFIPDTKSAILSFLVAVPSMNGILSLATSTVAEMLIRLGQVQVILFHLFHHLKDRLQQ